MNDAESRKKQFAATAQELERSIQEGRRDADWQANGFMAIRDQDADGEVNALLLYAWGDSARTLNQKLNLVPGPSTRPLRDKNSPQ